MRGLKSSLADLALFGAEPAFIEPLHVGRPNIGDRARLRNRWDAMLSSRWLTNDGPQVEEFEQRLAEFLGVRHAVAVCNATMGLGIAARALELSGEVIVPSFTYVGSAHALHWQGLTPVFCDIDPGTHNIDPTRVEELITPRTSGILGVHIWGRPCDTDTLTDIARRRGLRLFFDAAHALGCTSRGRMVGGLGEVEVLSFHATKVANALEGGAIVTNSDAIAARTRLMHNCGFADEDMVVSPGINAKMSEASAAMALTSLESLDEFIAINRRNHEAYARGLANLPGLQLVTYDHQERHNYHYVVVVVDEAVAGISRDVLRTILRAENVLARRYFPGCHLMEPYRSIAPDAGGRLLHTANVAARVLQLPTGTTVNPSTIDAVCMILRLALAQPGETMRLLARR